MIDRRETILARLAAVIAGLDVTAGRNRADVSESALPAIFLHDGLDANEDFPGSWRGPAVTKDMVKLEPQIIIAATGPAETIGATINGLRAQLLVAVLTDAELLAAVGANGQIRYVGCALTTEGGESREGQMEVKFGFRYLLAISELQS